MVRLCNTGKCKGGRCNGISCYLFQDNCFRIIYFLYLVFLCNAHASAKTKTKNKFSSLSATTKIEELTAGSDEKTQRSPPGIKPKVLRILVARSNHWATKPQRELRVNSRLSPSCQFFFHYEVTRIARVYKHAATNDNSLDLDPFNRKLALVGIIPIKFSSLSAPTKIEELTAGSDEKTQRSLYDWKTKKSHENVFKKYN